MFYFSSFFIKKFDRNKLIILCHLVMIFRLLSYFAIHTHYDMFKGGGDFDETGGEAQGSTS